MGPWWWDARVRWQDAWWGCSVPGCSVPCGAARCRDALCPVAGCPVPERLVGCPVAGCPVGVPGGGEARGGGAVLTAALEALPAAAPDEVPAKVAPGVQPAAPRLEAVSGARYRRQPRVGVRSGAGAGPGPAGRADAQSVGPFQAAPARPRLRLQLPQLDELHSPAAAGAARRRGGGRHRGWGRGGDREGPPRPDTAGGKLRQELGASRGPDRRPRSRQARRGGPEAGMKLPEPLPGKGGAPLWQPHCLRQLSQQRGEPCFVPQFPSGEGGWGNLSAGEKQPKLPQRAPMLCSATAPAEQPGLGARSQLLWPARDGFLLAVVAPAAAALVQSLFWGVCVGRMPGTPSEKKMHHQPFPAVLRPRLQPFGSSWWPGGEVGMRPKAEQATSKPCWWAGGQALTANVTSTERGVCGEESPLRDGR